MAAFALRTTRALVGGRLQPVTVTVEGGRVAALGPSTAPLTDLGDRVLLPGLIDSHVHVNEPGRAEWEGWQTATQAAALGGVTALVDMPLNSIPVTTSAAALAAKVASTAGKLWVDAGFWGGVVPGNTGELAPMVAGGARGFKCFLCPSGIDEFPAAEAEDLREAMPELRRLGAPLLCHAELELPLRAAATDDRQDYAAWLHRRPPEWEDAAVALLVAMVEETGCPAHVVHLSSAGALALVRDAKARGLPLTAETCPHYLVLTAEEVPRGDTRFKCAPPIRPAANREALWAALKDGTLDFVVTDHSPCIPALKRLEDGDFLEAWGGVASLQLGLSSVWTEARRRGVDLPTLVRWMTSGPARLAGLRAPSLAVGAPADLVAFDPDAAWTVDQTTLAHRNPISPWHGRALTGRVSHTWLRGQPVVADGGLVGAPAGRPLLSPREPTP